MLSFYILCYNININIKSEIKEFESFNDNFKLTETCPWCDIVMIKFVIAIMNLFHQIFQVGIC